MKRPRGATPKRLEAMGHALQDGTATTLIGVCVTCEDRHWFEVDDVGECCPADITEAREHAVNYYVLCGVRRKPGPPRRKHLQRPLAARLRPSARFRGWLGRIGRSAPAEGLRTAQNAEKAPGPLAQRATHGALGGWVQRPGGR